MRASGLAISRFAPPPVMHVASAASSEVSRLRAMVERLADELASTRYELEQMRAVHADLAAPIMARWSLTRGEALFLAVLLERGAISREGMDLALYGARSRGDKVLDVWLCKCRQKIGGLEVETVLGWGWRMSAESRARIRREIGEDA